jgi:hypothetical protein
MDAGIELVQVEKDGIIDYPIYPGQLLTGVWNVVPNPTGPAVTPQDDYLHYSVTHQSGFNQWVRVAINTPVPTNWGCLLVFRLRANVVQGQEVKFSLPSGVTPGGVILRFTDEGTNVWWQSANGSFQNLAQSTILPDGTWHDIVMAFTSGAIALWEDGNYLFNWQTAVGDQIAPVFDMQVLTPGSNLSFDVGDIYTVPPLFAPGIDTPWDFSFNLDVWPSEQAMNITTSPDGDGLQISFESGYVRFAAEPLISQNSWAFLSMPQSAPAISMLTYRIRVNESAGYETKITLLGGNILRLTENGSLANWQWWDGAQYQTLALSGVAVGASDFTIVTIITSATQLTLLENGIVKFNRTYQAVTEWDPSLSVQHWTAGSNVSVDIGGIRTLPSIKQPELLAIDLQDELLGYFPLMGDLSNAAGTSGDLMAIGGEPAYILGPYGLAANFSDQQVVLALPQLPTSTSPSYTLSVWVKVNSYPTADTRAGIVSNLLLNSFGHLQFIFVFNKERVYQQETFTSAAPLSIAQWHNVIVTYSYEESRLGIYVDGKADSIFYIGDVIASASAIIPAMFYVGGYKTGYEQPMIVLDGAVGQLFFFTQHVHQPTITMLANVPAQLKEGAEAILLLPVVIFFVVAFVVEVGIKYLNQTNHAPTLSEVVNRILLKVGIPARKGAKVSRTELGLSDEYPILLDIGGEGRLNVNGYITGFEDAININAPDKRSDPSPPTVTAVGPNHGMPIENLVELQPWDTDPEYPFTDSFANRITAIGVPLTAKNVKEIARVIRNGGKVDLWIDQKYKSQAELLAQNLNSVVQEVEEISIFKKNGIPGMTWYIHRRIIAHKRRVIFYATDFSNLAPLVQCANEGTISHVLVGLFHLGYDDEVHKTGPYIHLNNLNPNDPAYNSLWSTVQTLQSKGVRVLGSLGGGGVGDYGNLFATPQSYNTFYGKLRTTLQQYNLDGLDLDIEERDPNVNTQNILNLVNDLRNDFQSHAGGFTIVSAPVPSALTGGMNISPYVDYRQLIYYVDFYLLQFYNGFGNLNPADKTRPHYADVINKVGSTYASKLVAGVLTNPIDGSPPGSGYNSLAALGPIIGELLKTYPDFGGISGWTYQHALNQQGNQDPLVWSTTMRDYLKKSSAVFDEAGVLQSLARPQ